VFFKQKNKWIMGIESNIENFEFWVMPITKFALDMITIHEFQKLRLE